MTNKSFTSLYLETRQQFPKFKMVSKQNSLFMKFLNVLLKIISFGQLKNFMRFTTTIGYTIYTSENWDHFSEENKIELLRHERIHMYQLHKYGFLFFIMYLFLPFPILCAHYRKKFEQEAYEESMRCLMEEKGSKSFTEQFRDRMIKRFTGSSYLWCWHSSKDIEKWYDDFVGNL